MKGLWYRFATRCAFSDSVAAEFLYWRERLVANSVPLVLVVICLSHFESSGFVCYSFYGVPLDYRLYWILAFLSLSIYIFVAMSVLLVVLLVSMYTDVRGRAFHPICFQSTVHLDCTSECILSDASISSSVLLEFTFLFTAYLLLSNTLSVWWLTSSFEYKSV